MPRDKCDMRENAPTILLHLADVFDGTSVVHDHVAVGNVGDCLRIAADEIAKLRIELDIARSLIQGKEDRVASESRPKKGVRGKVYR